MLEFCPDYRLTSASIMVHQCNVFSLFSLCKERWETPERQVLLKYHKLNNINYIYKAQICAAQLHLCVVISRPI